MKKNLMIMKKNETKIHAIMGYRIKSSIQTYDIRDSEEYYGVIELEKLIQDSVQSVKRLSSENLDNFKANACAKTLQSLNTILLDDKNMKNQGQVPVSRVEANA